MEKGQEKDPTLAKTNPQGWATQRRFSELRRGHPPPSNVSVVIASVMNRAKIRIVPQLEIRLIKGQFALKNFVEECVHRHDVVNVRDLAIVD